MLDHISRHAPVNHIARTEAPVYQEWANSEPKHLGCHLVYGFQFFSSVCGVPRFVMYDVILCEVPNDDKNIPNCAWNHNEKAD
jgi:hypothetical protein